MLENPDLNHPRGIVEEVSWRRHRGREAIEEESCTRNHGGGIWRRNHGVAFGGVMLQEGSCRRNQIKEILEEESCKKKPGGGIKEQGSRRRKQGRGHE